MKYNDYFQQPYSKNETRGIEYFQNKFECRIQDSREYNQYVRQMPYYKWDGKEPYNLETQVVPMKAIHLSSDNLERLIREQDRMDRLMDDAEYGKKVWAEERKDRMIRDQNPAVQKAYEKYLMLLEIAR